MKEQLIPMQQTIVLPSGFSFDVTNMLGEGRIQPAEVEALAPRIRQAAEGVDKIRKEGRAKNHLSKDGTPEPVLFPRLPYPGPDSPNTPELLQELKEFGEQVREKQDAVVFCGVGGSYLGGKVLADCCASSYWHRHLDPMPAVFFGGNNVDPEDADNIRDGLVKLADKCRKDLNRPLRVLLVPISKSGTTLEPTAAFLHYYSFLKGEESLFQVSCAVVTDKRMEKGPLNRLARKYGWPMFDVLNGVGGRFSVLSTPGLVVGAVLGMDLEELLRGAREMDQACQGSDLDTNPALLNAVLKYLGAKNHGAVMEVIMPYSLRLKALGEWYVQLLAESLGKRKDRDGNTVFYGRTPVVAIGTTDMHSQTQLHQDGRRDKAVQFLFVDSEKGRVHIRNPFPEITEYDKYEGLDMGQALEVAMESNEEALASDQRLNALYRLPDVNEYMLGHLFYFLMLSIAYEGELANVDAYDQPGVEIYKRLMGEKLKKR